MTVPGITTPFSAQVLGTMTFGDTVDTDTAREMITCAVDGGVSVIDTANGYAGGATEEMLGELLPQVDRELVLCTKAGMPHPDAGEHAPLSPQGLRLSLQGSLRRLGREHVDLFYLHQPDRRTPMADTVATIGEFLTEGKISAWGVSNFAAWQISELSRIAAEQGVSAPVVGQQLYNLVARRIEDEYAEYAQISGLHTMVYNPLAGGLLTGKYAYADSPGAGRFGTSRLASMYSKRYWTSDLFEAIEALGRIADGAGITLVELSLRWLISRPVTSSVLLGGSKPAQLASNMDVLARGPLPEDVVAACDELAPALRGPMPDYNR